MGSLKSTPLEKVLGGLIIFFQKKEREVTLQYIYCNDCFDNLAKYDTQLLRAWMNIVKLFEKCRICQAGEDIHPDLEVLLNGLESLGFISTCDCATGFLMKLNGIHPIPSTKNKCIICINPDNHS